MSTLLPVHQQISGTPQTKGFQSFFHKLPEKPPALVRIFDRGDFYTVHGSDAAFVAQRVFKTTSVVKQFVEGSDKLEYTTLSKLNFESLLRDLLLVQRYRVQVYKCNSSSSKNTNDWSLQFQGSPGNLTQFEDVLFGSSSGQDSGGILAVRLVSQNDGKLVGAAVVDATLQQITLAEFADGDQLGNLEALLVQLGPRECLLCPSDGDVDAVRQVMVRNNVLVTEVKRSDFSSSDMTSDLTRLLRPGRQSDLQEATDRRHAMQALSAAVRYLRLLESGSEHLGQFSWTDFHLDRYVRLDGAAVRALNLLPAAADVSAVTHSLLGLLNRCRTAQGSRLLAQWLKQPLRDVRQIDERLDLVEAFTEDAELRLALLEDHLRRVPDLQRLCKRLQRRRASLQDCYKVYRAVHQLDSLISLLHNSSSRHASVLDVNFVQPLKQCVQDFQKFMQMVESTVDLESADKGTFVVKAEFDEDLQELRGKMTELEDSLDELLDRAAAELGLEARKTVKLESTPQMGYFFRITRKDEMILRNHKNYRTLETNKSGIKFRSESLLRVNDEFQQTSRAYIEQQKAVVDEIVAIAAGYLEPMAVLNETLARLDALVGMATAGLSAPTPYVRPRLLSADDCRQPTELLQLRHPCVEVQDGVSFIPNDVRFQHGQSTFKVITGPNMAGKSTYIRSVAVTVIMAQIGCFVPCESAVIRPVDAVMARVGAGDCQMKGVSTFMAEMLETSSILRSATRDSLLVIDELGRGTSTYDGFGLAWAISEHIVREIGAFTLFATHFHELTALATELTEVENLHVTALVHVPTSAATGASSSDGRGRLTFLYRVAAGVCDQSFGIHVAEMVQFPDQVLADARRRAAQLEDFYGSDGFGTTESGSEEAPSSKRVCLDQEAGQELMQTFLSDYDALEGSDEDVQRQVESLMGRLRQLNHSYVSHLLQRFKLC